MAEKKSLLREMMDLASATKAVDFASFRKHLPIAYLLETHGFPVEEAANGALKSNCPFHQADGGEHNQTFTVFGEDLERFNCWSCPVEPGDAVDLLKHFEPELAPNGENTAALFRRVQDLISEVIESGWNGPVEGKKHEPFDILEAKEIVEVSQANSGLGRIQEFIDYKRGQRGRKSWPYDPAYLAETWGVGTYGSMLIIPFLSTDGELYAYKTWQRPEKQRFSAARASFTGHMYGEWLEDTGNPIIVTEGESDTWYAHYLKGEDFRVLGVPTGAKTSPDALVEALAGRSVYLAFDGDDAGRMALGRWNKALKLVDANVKILPIPEGKDLSTAGDIDLLLEDARVVVEAPSGLTATPDGYTKFEGKKGVEVSVSNFVVEPTRSLRGDGVRAFECLLMPGNTKVVLLADDLDSKSKIKAWASSHGRTWFGEERDAAILKGMLQAEEVFLPSGELVTTSGLHNGTFVWPGGRIGPRDLTYSPPVADAHLEKKIRIFRRPVDTSLVHLMRDIQKHEITDPMLAWLATTPVRSYFDEYPFVGVTGAHGAGKTMTTKTLIRAFTGSEIVASFLSSPHAMRTALSATNADPVQLEEMRRDSNQKTLEYGRSVLRNAWDMTPDEIGGRGQKNFAEITSVVPAAPICVTGEDELSEGSHVDRMVGIDMIRETQNAAKFAELQENIINGHAFDFRSFLTDKITRGEITRPIQVKPQQIPGLTGRQQISIAILQLGWHWLQEYMAERNDNLDAPHFGEVVERMRKSNKRTPIEEAIFWCVGQSMAQGFCRKVDPKEGETGEPSVKIQVEEFLSFINHPARAANFPMPGGSHAIRNYLLSRLDGTEQRDSNMREFIVIPLRLVLPNR